MRVLSVVILIVFSCLRLPAPLLPGPNLAKRTESADSIVVARLVSGTTLAAGSQVSSDFVLRVERVLKGNLTPGSEIGAHLEGRGYFVTPNAKESAITEHLFGIWFLSSVPHPNTVISRDGSYGELYSAPVMLPEDDKAAPTGKPGDTPAASVANELVAALQWMADTHGAQLNPQAEHAGTPEERKLASLSLNQFRNLSEDFRTLSPATTLASYRQFALAQSAPLRALGIQGLIAANDPEGVKHAAAEWTDLAASADMNPIINILMVYSNGDPDAVRALGTLALRDPAPDALRQNAAYALRAIHTKEALPALVALLDNKQERIRPYALSGLCLFVRNAPAVNAESVPSMSWMQSRKPAPLLNPETESHCLLGAAPPNGTTDLDAYASFWKSWWSEHQSEFEKP